MKNKGPKDEQFKKLKNPVSDRGSVPASEGNAGDDEQFDDGDEHMPQSKGSKSSKSSGGEFGKFDGGKPHPAASIMREIAKALMKGPGADQEYQGDKKKSSPKSKSQTKDFDASSEENEQGRSKTQKSQSVSQKKVQSKPGSKT